MEESGRTRNGEDGRNGSGWVRPNFWNTLLLDLDRIFSFMELLYSALFQPDTLKVERSHDTPEPKATIHRSSRLHTEKRGRQKYWLHSGSVVNGFVYWTHTNKPYMRVLTATMRFFRIDLPRYLMGQGPTFRVGETNDGKPCIVGVVVFLLLVSELKNTSVRKGDQ
jgi:hypothetical protein